MADGCRLVAATVGFMYMILMFVFLLPLSGTQSLTDVRAQERKKVWSWRSETQKRGIFEIDWQQSGDVDRIALALESKKVGIIDISKIPALQRTMR